MIHADARSDDDAVAVRFDATPWFEQASDSEVVALAGCGWGGDYPADAVAEHLRSREEGVALLFDYLDARNGDADEPVGFEVHIDACDALAWLKSRRLALYARVAGHA